MDFNTCLATTEAYRDLALYSHVIPALATLILGVFAYLRAPDRLKAGYFLCFSIVFAAWLVGDLIVWTSDPYNIVAAFWAPLDFTEITFFLLIFAFLVIELSRRTLSLALTISILLAVSVPLFFTTLGQSVHELYLPECEMLNNRFLENYKVILEALLFLTSAFLGIRYFLIAQEHSERLRVVVITVAVTLFMGVFGGTEYIANTTYVYETHLYALFTLPLFVLLLTIAITSLGTFKLGDAAVKALFYVFLVLAGTQFFFAGDLLEFLLASMSFVVILVLGFMLFRAVEKEIEARHIIEEQEKELEAINRDQESLLHFMSHEIKGYLTKSEAGFAAIVEGDYGHIPEKLKAMSWSALTEVRKGVSTVMEILDASNFKKGTVMYKKEHFDFRDAVIEALNELRPVAEEKGLAIDATAEKGAYPFVGDKDKLQEHAIRNLIDNAIQYTPHGTITVELRRVKEFYRFSVKDQGVGINEEDMHRLFTEGGHGKESIKVNVHSTGYGLYIAKRIVTAHGGRIWAESGGEGRGATFIVELPAA